MGGESAHLLTAVCSQGLFLLPRGFLPSFLIIPPSSSSNYKTSAGGRNSLKQTLIIHFLPSLRVCEVDLLRKEIKVSGLV